MLNYRNSIVLLAMSFLLVFSCKKNETEDTDNNSTNNNDTSTISSEYGVIYCSITGMDNMNGQMVIGLMNDANEWSKGEDGTAFQQYISAIKLYHKFHQKSTKNLPKVGQKFSQTFPYTTDDIEMCRFNETSNLLKIGCSNNLSKSGLE